MRVLMLSLGVIAYIFLDLNQCTAFMPPGQERKLDSKVDPKDPTLAEAVVPKLTDDNFDSMISTFRFVFLMFTDSECDMCREVYPELRKAAYTLKDSPEILVATCEAHNNYALASEYTKGRFPHMLFFRDGVKHEIDLSELAPRARSIVKYIQKNSDVNWRPPPPDYMNATVELWHSHVSLKNSMTNKFIMICDPKSDHFKEYLPEFKKIAKRLNHPPNGGQPSMTAMFDGTGTDDGTQEILEEHNVTSLPYFLTYFENEMLPYNPLKISEEEVLNAMGYLSASRLHKLYGPDLRVQHYLNQSEYAPRIVGISPGFNDVVKEYKEAKAEGLEGEEIPEKLRRRYVLGMEFRRTVRMTGDYYTFGNVIECPETDCKHDVIMHHPPSLLNEFQKSNYSFLDDFYTPGAGGKIADRLITFYRETQPLVSMLETKVDLEKTVDPRAQVILYFDFEVSLALKKQKEAWFQYRKLLTVAKGFDKRKQEVAFYIADTITFQGQMDAMGFFSSENEVNVGIWYKGLKYVLKDDFSYLKDLINDVLSGEAKPFYLSAKKPKSNKGSVKVAVGKTFNKIVNNKKKDVLIYVYKKTSPVCRKFAPIYQKLGNLFKKEKHVVIAKINAEKNDIPKKYQSVTYPAIFLARKGKKQSEPLKYNGEKKVKSIVAFLQKHTTSTITTVPSKGKKKMKEEL